jgi:hypothetical protein
MRKGLVYRLDGLKAAQLKNYGVNIYDDTVHSPLILVLDEFPLLLFVLSLFYITTGVSQFEYFQG